MFQYNIDSASRTVLVLFSGRSSMDETLQFRRLLASDPRFRNTFNELVDLEEFSGSESGYREISARAADSDPFSPSARRAIFAPTDFAFGMARMYIATRRAEDTIALFRDLESARKWLGIDEAAVDRLFSFERRSTGT